METVVLYCFFPIGDPETNTINWRHQKPSWHKSFSECRPSSPFFRWRVKVWKLCKNRVKAGKDARQQPLTWKNGKGSPEDTNKKKRWSHKCVVSNTQPLTTSWQTPVCVYMCFPPKIFTSRENTIESQQKPQGSSIRFIRLGVKPGYMQGAKKDFNAQNVIISVGELAGEGILCSASTVGSFTKLQSTSKKKNPTACSHYTNTKPQGVMLSRACIHLRTYFPGSIDYCVRFSNEEHIVFPITLRFPVLKRMLPLLPFPNFVHVGLRADKHICEKWLFP